MRMHFGIVAGSLVALAAAPVMADTVVVNNPSQWANTSDNEQPVSGDNTTATTGIGSWVSDPTLSNSDQHFLYFQGTIDTGTNPDISQADPSNGDNPQLLFSSSDPFGTPSISDISRISWDTKKKNTVGSGHWFAQIKTTDHLVTFALTDDSNYTTGSWNTLTAGQSDSTASIGDSTGNGLEVAVYDQDDFGSGTYTSQTFAQWASDASGGNAPAWWNEDIKYGGLATATNYDNFDSNLDTIFVSVSKDGHSQSRTLDLEPVPTPSAAALGLLVLGGLTIGRTTRRRRRTHEAA